MSNLTLSEQKALWKYVDSPWDLLTACEELRLSKSTRNTLVFCIFSHVMGFWSAYILPIISSFGIISNMITIYILTFKLHDRTRQYIYLSFIAACDSVNIICYGWIWIFFAKGLPYASMGRAYFFTYNQGEISCRLHRYFIAAVSCSASSIFLLASVDRCFAIFWPLKCINIPFKRAWRYSLGVVLFCFLLMSPFAIYMGYTETGNQKILCWIKVSTDEQVLGTFLQVYNVLFSFCGSFQTLAIIVVNIGLFYQINKGQKVRDQIRAARCSSVRKEMSACVILLVLSILYTICSLPTSISFILAFLMQKATGQEAEDRLRFAYNIGDIGWNIYMLQLCTNGLIFYWKMQSFRNAFHRMLHILPVLKTTSTKNTFFQDLKENKSV